MCPLLGRQRAGEIDLHCDIEIPMLRGLSDDRHAVAFETKHLSVLRRRWNLEADGLSRERGDFGLAAEYGCCERNRDVRIEIAPLRLEGWMRCLPDAQIQVPGLTAARAQLAFAADADARSFADAGWNPHVDGAGL